MVGGVSGIDLRVESARARTTRLVDAIGALAAIAANQWGVVSIADLHRCGLSYNAIASAGPRAVGCTPFIAVFTHSATHGSSLEGQFMAAVKACGEGTALSHFGRGRALGRRQVGRPVSRGHGAGQRHATPPRDTHPPEQHDRGDDPQGHPGHDPGTDARRPRLGAAVPAAPPRGAPGIRAEARRRRAS